VILQVLRTRTVPAVSRFWIFNFWLCICICICISIGLKLPASVNLSLFPPFGRKRVCVFVSKSAKLFAHTSNNGVAKVCVCWGLNLNYGSPVRVRLINIYILKISISTFPSWKLCDTPVHRSQQPRPIYTQRHIIKKPSECQKQRSEQ